MLRKCLWTIMLKKDILQSNKLSIGKSSLGRIENETTNYKLSYAYRKKK